MTLREYMNKKGITLREMDKRTGINFRQLCKYKNLTVLPSIPSAIKINNATEGKVGLKDWVKDV